MDPQKMLTKIITVALSINNRKKKKVVTNIQIDQDYLRRMTTKIQITHETKLHQRTDTAIRIIRRESLITTRSTTITNRLMNTEMIIHKNQAATKLPLQVTKAFQLRSLLRKQQPDLKNLRC